jgi:hypothetical protein
MLNNTIKKLIASALILAPIPVAADSLENQRFKIGLERMQYHYKETSNGQKLMSTEGPLFGINAEYYRDLDNQYFLNMDARALTGIESYDGHLINLQTGARTPYSTGYSTRNHLFEARITPGLKSGGFNFYTGLGYRVKTDAPMNSYTYSYPRKSQYFYVPVGVTMPTEYWDVSMVPYIEGDVLLQGKQTSDLSNLGKSRNTQKNGFGVKAGVAIKLDEFEIIPQVNYWHIGDSDIDRVQYQGRTLLMVEPENTTWEIGLKVTYTF